MMEQNGGNVPASQNQTDREINLCQKNTFISNFIYQTSIPVNEKKTLDGLDMGITSSSTLQISLEDK